jgi:GTPase SAR1 family protein
MVVDRVTWKISVAGMKGSGKSSLISRIVYGTDGTNGHAKLLSRKRVTMERGESKVIADLLLQEIGDDAEAERLLPGSSLIIVVADIMARDSLLYAEDAIRYAKNFEKKPPVVLVGTKTDLRYEAELWTEDFDKSTRKLKVDYFMVSARGGEGVPKLMDHVLNVILERFYAKKQSGT